MEIALGEGLGRKKWRVTSGEWRERRGSRETESGASGAGRRGASGAASRCGIALGHRVGANGRWRRRSWGMVAREGWLVKHYYCVVLDSNEVVVVLSNGFMGAWWGAWCGAWREGTVASALPKAQSAGHAGLKPGRYRGRDYRGKDYRGRDKLGINSCGN